jgi:hypothetical protein
MNRWSSPYFIGAVVAALVIAAAVLWYGGYLAPLFDRTEQTEGEDFVPTTPEEKMRILESLPPLQRTLSPEEKRAILEQQ